MKPKLCLKQYLARFISHRQIQLDNYDTMEQLERAYWFYTDVLSTLHVPRTDRFNHGDRRNETDKLSLRQFLTSCAPILGWKADSIYDRIRDYHEGSKKMPRAGGIILNAQRTHMVLVRQQFNSRWTIPHGKVRGAESLIDAARREIKEETGLLVDAPNHAFALPLTLPEKYTTYTYFLFVLPDQVRELDDSIERQPESSSSDEHELPELHPASSEEIAEAAWWPLDSVRALSHHHDLFRKALDYIDGVYVSNLEMSKTSHLTDNNDNDNEADKLHSVDNEHVMSAELGDTVLDD